MTRSVLICSLTMIVASSALAQVGVPVNGFPKWEERYLHEWTNRARCDPQVEMTACGANCWYACASAWAMRAWMACCTACGAPSLKYWPSRPLTIPSGATTCRSPRSSGA